MRGNKQIWRIAEFIYKAYFREREFPEKTSSFGCFWYDTALELQRKMLNNEFTGPDNHEN